MKKKDATKKVPTEVGTLAQLVLPLAELVRGDLQAFVVSVGIQAITAMLESERTELAGPRYQHDPDRRASRGGTTPGKLTLGGRQITVRRPRVVDRNGDEVPLGTWQELAAEDPMNARVLEQMTRGVATRKYERSLEPVPEEIESSGTSKSAVSRRFVEITTEKMREWMTRSLAELGGQGVAAHAHLLRDRSAVVVEERAGLGDRASERVGPPSRVDRADELCAAP